MKDVAAALEATRRQNAEGCVKTSEDLDRYRLVIDRTRPRCVVELGTFSGKSAVWFHREARCPVITVDVHKQVDDATVAAGGDQVVWLIGDSSSAPVADTVRALVDELSDGGQVLVVLDSDHSVAHVTAEMNLYSPLVQVGGYMVVEDGLLRWMDPVQQAYYRGTPLDAIEAWLPEHPGWVSDRDLEDLFEQTQHPSGWLRRLR